MVALHLHDVAKVVQPQEGRFPTMPGEVNHRTGGSVDVLDNVFLQNVVGHAKRLALRIEVFLLQVVTIVTVQIADRANGFDKNLKFARGLDHCLISNLPADLVRHSTEMWPILEKRNACLCHSGLDRGSRQARGPQSQYSMISYCREAPVWLKDSLDVPEG